MENIKLYVVGHKKFELPNGTDQTYQPIMVGSLVGGDEYLSDDSGDNISAKNPYYCELTACYWIWKNISSIDYIGICHYRRFFWNEGHILHAEEIKDILHAGYQIILPSPIILKKDNCGQFYIRGAGYKRDLIHLRNVIQDRSPEYLFAFDNVLKAKSASYSNMLICSKEIYDDYCNWLFDLLFELEKITDLSGYTQQEKRVYGYLSELLLNVYCKKKELKTKYLDVKLIASEQEQKAIAKKRMLHKGKEVVKHIIWFPSGIKPAKRRNF